MKGERREEGEGEKGRREEGGKKRRDRKRDESVITQ